MNGQGIQVEGGRRRGRKKTRIRVDRWPQHDGRGLRVSTQEDKKDGRILLATGYANFRNDQCLGSATVHVPGRKEPSLLITDLEVSRDLISETRRDAVLGLLACALDTAGELKAKLNVGDGCVEWQVSESEVKAALDLAQGFEPIDPNSKRAKRLRGRRILKRC
jgi:hypothetical protein